MSAKYSKAIRIAKCDHRSWKVWNKCEIATFAWDIKIRECECTIKHLRNEARIIIWCTLVWIALSKATNYSKFENWSFWCIQKLVVMCQTPFFQHQMNSNMFIYRWSNTQFLASNIEPNRAFTRFPKLLIELTRTSFFQTLNVFIYWLSNSNTLFLASNNWTSNLEHSSTHH